MADLTQAELAERAGVSVSAVRDFERGFSTLIPATVHMLVRALRKEGVEITGNPVGLRFIQGTELPPGNDEALKRLIETAQDGL